VDAGRPVFLVEQRDQGPHPSLPRKRLTYCGFGSGIPPVMMNVPLPRRAIAGATWAAAARQNGNGRGGSGNEGYVALTVVPDHVGLMTDSRLRLWRA
jgi:hypothetical protein